MMLYFIVGFNFTFSFSKAASGNFKLIFDCKALTLDFINFLPLLGRKNSNGKWEFRIFIILSLKLSSVFLVVYYFKYSLLANGLFGSQFIYLISPYWFGLKLLKRAVSLLCPFTESFSLSGNWNFRIYKARSLYFVKPPSIEFLIELYFIIICHELNNLLFHGSLFIS